MKRDFLFSGLLVVATTVAAQSDSLRLEQLQEVTVQGVTAQPNAPFAVTNIQREELKQFSTTGQELPFLFARTPGVLAWSENGTGIGTTYMRLRGVGDSRINVTLDGVPLNSPEDQCVFWANMNSYSAILGSAQIQRGVGTSTNGDGAFGGNIALSTKAPNPNPSAEVNLSYGSFNTMHIGANFSTGMLANSLIIDGAVNATKTDGYIHGTSGRSGSYYGGITWLGDNISLRYKNIGNFEKTGQAWNGVTAGNDDLSLMDGTYGASGFKSYQDMVDAGLGQYNSLYEKLSTDDNGFVIKDGKYQTERYTMSDGSYWKQTTDNFWQDHNILTLAWDMNEHWNMTASAYYTYGYGYYEEFRPNNKLKKFGLSNWTDPATGSVVKKSDFVRQKGLDQKHYGIVGNAGYTADWGNVLGGFSVNQFNSNHFGYITYVGNNAFSDYLLSDGRYTYYNSDATKTDANAFIKGTWAVTEGLDLFADLQFRYVGYVTDGYNDKFIDNDDGTYSKHYLDIDQKYLFVNPKVGISYHQGGFQAHALVAGSNREPERNNFTDNGNYPAPQAEKVTDYELGLGYTAENWFADANLYYMDYTNQFVQTGLTSDIGENLTTNIKDSYRAGIELSAGVSLTNYLSVEANAALSKNTIKDFDEVVEDWDNGTTTIHYDNSTLAFSPSAILNGFIDFHKGRWQAVWHTGYVSRQYMDNSQNKERSLAAYSASDFRLSYTLPMHCALQDIVFGVNVNNVFNAHYANAGWVYSAICDSYGHSNDNRYYQIGYIPMAGFNALGTITLRF